MAQAVKLGVCKINISSDVKSAYYRFIFLLNQSHF
ncbi:hypothetical protein ACTPEF_25240 [Clostridioides difficile]